VNALSPCSCAAESTVDREYVDNGLIRAAEHACRRCGHRWLSRHEAPLPIERSRSGRAFLAWPPATTRPVAPLDARPEPGDMSFR